MRRLGPIASPVTDHPALAALVSASPTMEPFTSDAISRESPRLTTTPVTGPGSHFPGLLTPSPSSPPVTLRHPPLRPILASPFLMASLPVSAQQVSPSPTPPLQAVVRPERPRLVSPLSHFDARLPGSDAWAQSRPVPLLPAATAVSRSPLSAPPPTAPGLPVLASGETTSVASLAVDAMREAGEHSQQPRQ
ncbi:hypothetical protein I4F81_010361 [Pyropia yezoensis]|uniref:Uncharacterized protein n=1 Tax=Pyropia yezoensis TaxID=2788 RepID=A0ACC3CD28_PYRYE|nr:hypothetical protein I4F81_010361 [Neopyropia yezoensis]